jgi:hypothetical protein
VAVGIPIAAAVEAGQLVIQQAAELQLQAPGAGLGRAVQLDAGPFIRLVVLDQACPGLAV